MSYQPDLFAAAVEIAVPADVAETFRDHAPASRPVTYAQRVEVLAVLADIRASIARINGKAA
jgi:hypothetical protein